MTDNTTQTFYDLPYLSVIAVCGADSATFLQGQLSCNIKTLTSNQSSIAAYCTAKGRVISVVLVVAHADGYWLILPSSLAGLVLKKLQMYVLRSQVKLTLTDIQLTGLKTSLVNEPHSPIPASAFAVTRKDSQYLIRLPDDQNCRCLLFDPDHQITTKAQDQAEWRVLDIANGLPWFEAEQSEQFTPHMLGLDKLGGISLDKGCYTGQEIVARTHYLGKNKRQCLVGELQGLITEENPTVIDPISHQALGHVLFAQSKAGKTHLLMILTTDYEGSGEYAIDNSDMTRISLIP